MLAVFNLVPIPPLDGSRIWPCVIPGMKPVPGGKWSLIGMVVLLLLLISGKIGTVIDPVLSAAMRLLPAHTPLSQVRPEGFPLELAAPENTRAFYMVHPIDSPDPNQFQIFFERDEPIPPDGLLSFLRGNYERMGWTELKVESDNPDVPDLSEWKMKTNAGEISYQMKRQIWFMPDRGLILVNITQSVPDPNVTEETAKTFVGQQFVTPDTDQYRKHLKTYKARHPEPSP